MKNRGDNQTRPSSNRTPAYGNFIDRHQRVNHHTPIRHRHLKLRQNALSGPAGEVTVFPLGKQMGGTERYSLQLPKHCLKTTAVRATRLAILASDKNDQ